MAEQGRDSGYVARELLLVTVTLYGLLDATTLGIQLLLSTFLK